MHRLRLRPVPVPGVQQQEVAAANDDEVDPFFGREGTSRNGWQPTADPLLTMELLRQLVATDGNGFGFFAASARSRFAPVCHRLQPRGSHKGSIRSCQL
jgi:hypothetical protein